MADQNKPNARDVAASTGSAADQATIDERTARLVDAGAAEPAPQGKYVAVGNVDNVAQGGRDNFAYLSKEQIQRLVDLGEIAEPSKLKRKQIDRLEAAGIRGEWSED